MIELVKLIFVGSCLLLMVSWSSGDSEFKDYVCLSERGVHLLAWHTKYHIITTNSTDVSDVYTKKECLQKCQDDAFAAYYDITGEDTRNESYEDMQRCFCFRMKKGNEAEMFPARIVDYSETVFNDNLDEITCKNSFSLSCKVNSTQNWCVNVDRAISYKITEHDTFQYEENFFPKCLSETYIKTDNLEEIKDKDKNMTVIQWRVTNCDEDLDYSILQGNSTKCGGKNVIDKFYGYVPVQSTCDRCSNLSPYETATCGDQENGLYSVYCSHALEVGLNSACTKMSVKHATSINSNYIETKPQEYNFTYFGCYTLPSQTLPWAWRKPNSKNCFEECLDRRKTAEEQIVVYMKPVKPADYNENSKNGNYINCVCNVLNKDSFLPTISDVSDGCDESWCPPAPGPCGSIQPGLGGYSLYCQWPSNPNGTDACFDLIANPESFYKNSPARFTPLGTTQKPTTEPTEPSTTSIIPSASTPLLSTEKPSTATPTTATPTPTPGCDMCPGRNDSRGHYWESACAGEIMVKDTYCPFNTSGFATWTCDNITLTFTPEEPDRTSCYAEWLDNVENMSKNSTADQKKITEEILRHLSAENITSGTLIRIIMVGIEMSSPIDFLEPVLTDSDAFFNSKNITKDYLQIASDLFQQKLAWKEMESSEQAFNSFELVRSNELMAYKHLDYVHTEEIDSDLAELPYTDNTFVDNRNMIKLHLFSGAENTSAGLPPWIKMQGSWLQDIDADNNTDIFGASYSKDLFPSGIFRTDDSVFEGRTNNIVFNTLNTILSFSINKQPIEFNGSTVLIHFDHHNKSLACSFCKRQCVSWDEKEHLFTSRGCSVQFSNKTMTICECSHLTNFGLMFDINNAFQDWDPVQTKILSILSDILLSFSCVCAFATFVILNLSKLPGSPRINIVKNRAFSLFGLYFLFLLGFDKNQFDVPQNVKDVSCSIVAILLHFFGLSTFCWTLLEGLQLNKSLEANTLTDIDRRKYTKLLRYLFGYGAPLSIITLTLGITYVLGFDQSAYQNTEVYCWLREKDFILAFAVPAGVVIVFNLYVFAKSFRIASAARVKYNGTTTEKLMGQVKSWIILSFLLGTTWSVGFFIQEGTQEFAYLFVLLNGSSGIFMFVHTILLNEVVLQELKINLGIEKNEKLAIDNSGSRLNGVKSFRRDQRPVLRKRSPRPRMPTDSSSSEEVLRQATYHRRKPARRTEVSGVYYLPEDITSGMSTPDSTSLASTSSNSDDYRELINNSRGSGIRTRVLGNTRVRKNNGYGNKIREPRNPIQWEDMQVVNPDLTRVQAGFPLYQEQGTRIQKYQDQDTRGLQHQDQETRGPLYQDQETRGPQYQDQGTSIPYLELMRPINPALTRVMTGLPQPMGWLQQQQKPQQQQQQQQQQQDQEIRGRLRFNRHSNKW